MFKSRPVIDRLLDLTKKTRGCWLWQGMTSFDGYGRIKVPGPDGLRRVMAHRAAYEALVGSIPPGLQLDHLCENKLCVNPSHLEPVTNQENKRRWANSITHCPKGHEYSEKNTRVYRGCRHCRLCGKIASRKSYMKRLTLEKLEKKEETNG